MMSALADVGPLLLFNDPRYLRLKLANEQTIFRYDHLVEDRWFGTLIGVQLGDVIDCGWKAPYGGPDIAGSGTSTTAIMNFLQDAIDVARKTNVKTLRIRTRPSYHSLNDTAVQFALLNLGFRVDSCEFAQGIDVTRFSSAEHYVSCLKASQRNQIRRGLVQADYHEVEAEVAWKEGYELLNLNRAFRGETLKFSIDYLLKLRSMFPQRLSMSVLRCSSRPIAAALVYRVSPCVDHIVAWGDDKSRRDIAPVGTIAVHLIAKAVRDRIAVLDIGISSVNGTPDDGLISFKRHSMATSSLRLNLIRDL